MHIVKVISVTIADSVWCYFWGTNANLPSIAVAGQKNVGIVNWKADPLIFSIAFLSNLNNNDKVAK